MKTIPQKELRNQVSAVLRRVESGETLTVTVSGRPVAQLAPIRKNRWVSGADLTSVWAGSAPRGIAEDLTQLAATITDPFAL